MYDEKFKEKVLEEFKRYPYFHTIAIRNNVSVTGLHYWVKKANIDVDALKKEIPEKRTYDQNKIIDKGMYESIIVKEEIDNVKKEETIEFMLNGYAIKIARKEIKKFIKGITND